MTSAAPLQITPGELSEWLRRDKNLQILDVREKWEAAICALPGARNIPMSEVPARTGEIDGNRPLVVYCHHGGRSLRAVQWLRGNGFEHATNLAGGIHQWSLQIDPKVPTY
jgi:sulfur-carrier protein adenylyltransferase/sulfurtransferase